MKNTTRENQTNLNKSIKSLDTVAEVVGWIKIMVALLAVGGVLGWITYYNVPNIFGMILGISIAIIGLLAGLYFANKAWRSKQGTVFTADKPACSGSYLHGKGNKSGGFCRLSARRRPVPGLFSNGP